jgi:hypothetical protein
VKEKGGKPDRKPYPLPYGLRNPYRKPQILSIFFMWIIIFRFNNVSGGFSLVTR